MMPFHHGAPKALCEALDASGVVGTWDWSPVTDLCRMDRGVVDLLSGDATLADQSIDRRAATAAIHPADAAWLKVELGRLAREGGLLAAEYRVIRPSGQVRWVMSRGRIAVDGAGRSLHGRGILIDTTDAHETGDDIVASLDARSHLPLDRASGHAIAVFKMLERDGTPALRALARSLLMEFGQEIARRLHP